MVGIMPDHRADAEPGIWPRCKVLLWDRTCFSRPAFPATVLLGHARGRRFVVGDWDWPLCL